MRKIRLTPVQRDLLWALEETGEETVACLCATLGHAEDGLRRAAAGLERLGYVFAGVGRDGRPTFVLTRSGRTALQT